MIRLMPGSMLPRRMPPSSRTLVLGQIALGDPAVAPTGAHAALHAPAGARATATAATSGSFRSTAAGPRALTAGRRARLVAAVDVAGDRVLFLRDEQVWAVPLAGGEPERLTALAARRQRRSRRRPTAGGSRSPRRRPSRASPSGALDAGAPPLARVMTRVDWRLDGDGYRRPAHAPLRPAGARRAPARVALTHGDWSVESFAWSPDGTRHRVLRRSAATDADFDAAPAVYVVAGARRRAASSSRASRARAGGVSLVAGRRARRLPRHRRGRASRTAARTRSGSCRLRAARRATSLRAGTCTCRADARLRPRRLGGRRRRRPRLGRPTRCVSPLTTAGQTALWRFPLDGEPAQIARLRAAHPRLARSAAGASSRCARRTPACVELHLEDAGGAPRRLTRDGAAWGRRALRRRLRAGLDPGPGRADPRDARRAAWRGARGAPARALDHRRAGRQLGARAVAARLRARGRRRAHADARSARLGELRPRRGSRRSAASGAAPTPRISSPASTGRWGRGSPIRRAWASPGSPTAAS